MTHVTAEMAKKTDQETKAGNDSPEPSRDNAALTTALDHLYGQIGISAVAAAARYQGVAKNPAYAPAQIDWHDRTEEEAA